MSAYTFECGDERDTERLGAALAAVLPERCVVSLVGTLGAGKTRLVQALAAACGVPRTEVVSPTYMLCHEYQGTRTLYHFDAYRLERPDEFLQLGADEYFAERAVSLVEWGDRVANLLPEERLEIDIEVVGESRRRVTLRSVGTQFSPLPARVRDALLG